MQPFSFQCPHCDALLRVKDRALVGREVPCPDCGESFRLAFDGRHVSILDVEPASGDKAPQPQQGAVTTRTSQAAAARNDGDANDVWWKEPHVIAWAVAAVFGTCMAVVIATDTRLLRNEKANAAKTAPADVADKSVPEDPPAAEDELVAPPSLWELPGVDPQGQLSRLGLLIGRQRQESGHFPQGTTGSGESSERFSWLAAMVAQSAENRVAADWDQSWMDPVNQRFVRRRMPVYLNPAVKPLAGGNGFPAGHFVGMAGVGADAATLPVSHERAGIFGYDRKTTEADVKDGLAQTIMVAGVQSRLGSWAAGGPATVRGFVAEPYINGPDGFGSGQKDGMWVLMADGSVKFRTIETTAEILRGEAAMADAFYREHPPQQIAENKTPTVDEASEQKTDKDTPPVDDVSIDELVRIVDEIAETDKQKRERDAAAAAPPPLTDEQIHARLDQAVVRYRSGVGATFGPVFEELAEMVAVPLDYDARPWRRESGLWDRPVHLECEDVTIGEVLEQLLESVGLRATIGDGKIVIQESNKT